MLRIAAGALAGAAVLVLPAAASLSAAPERAALALLVDGRLVRTGLTSGSVRVWRVAPLRRTIQSGPLLAVEPGRRTVYALVRSQVVALDARTLAVKRRFRLPAGTVYRGLALGPVSRRLYVSGNRAVRVLDRATGLAEEDATVTVLDPRSGAVLGRPVVREARGRSWHVYWISLAADERHVALAYHGGCDGVRDTCTTGVDVLPVDGASVGRCRPVEPQSRGTACTPDVHGAAVPLRDGFLAATGGPPLVRIGRDGRVVGRLTTGMATHLMDVAVDAAVRTAYAVGPCDKGGGLRAVDLESGAVRRLRTARGPRALCGSRVAVASGSALVVPTGRSIALLSRILPAVLVVDSRSGRTLRRVRVGAPIADVAVA